MAAPQQWLLVTPAPRTTSYLQAGDAVDAAQSPSAVRTDHWYFISGIDVVSPGAAAVVTLGNSVTDGRGSGTNRQNRWPDELARRLQADPRTHHVAVLNMGMEVTAYSKSAWVLLRCSASSGTC